MAKEHVNADAASHICTTLFTDLTHLIELEFASALTQPGHLNQKNNFVRQESDPNRPTP